MIKKIIKISALIAMFIIIVYVSVNYYSDKKTTALEIGIFVGSNWEVANANSYVIIDKAIGIFEKEHKNVKVSYYSGILKEDYSEWLSRKLLLGEEPDVFMVLSDDFNQLVNLGALKNIDELIEKDDSFHKERFYATTLHTGEHKGVQYALPYETVPTLMFVNKTLLSKEGIDIPKSDWSWEDFYSICERVTKDLDGDGTLDQFGMYNYDWLDAVYTSGGILFDERNMRINIAHDSVIESVRLVQKLNTLNKDQKVTQEDFDSGRVAFMPLPFSDYRTYKTYPYKIKKYMNFQWECITLPAAKGYNNVSEVNTLLMGISNRSDEEELAWEFLKLLTYNEEIQMDIFRYSQGASVLKAVTDSKEAENILQEYMEESEKVIDNELLSKIIEEGTAVPKLFKYEEVISLATSEIQGIIEKDKNIESTLKILQRKVNKYLSQ
ncbi:ABC transporter substrate-binding protein [Alloiococcus sp. CFN-8]|uniref:ABC transporter substrate-binding protein n=1 Tax=Alloiococcus sp. CFN-8 TaxID=3416081 RepID=UPI003CE8D121